MNESLSYAVVVEVGGDDEDGDGDFGGSGGIAVVLNVADDNGTLEED